MQGNLQIRQSTSSRIFDVQVKTVWNSRWIFKLRSVFFFRNNHPESNWFNGSKRFSNLGGVWCAPAAARWEDWKIHLPGHAGVGGLAGMSAMCLLAHPEVVPPELAAAALEAFYEAEDGKTRILMMIQWYISIVHISSFGRDGNFQVWPAACFADDLCCILRLQSFAVLIRTFQWASQFTALGRSWKRMKYPPKGQSKCQASEEDMQIVITCWCHGLSLLIWKRGAISCAMCGMRGSHLE